MAFFGLLAVSYVEEYPEHHSVDDIRISALATSGNPSDLLAD